MIVLRNQNLIPEIRGYMEMVYGQRADRETCAAQVEKMQGYLVGQEVEQFL